MANWLDIKRICDDAGTISTTPQRIAVVGQIVEALYCDEADWSKSTLFDAVYDITNENPVSHWPALCELLIPEMLGE